MVYLALAGRSGGEERAEKRRRKESRASGEERRERSKEKESDESDEIEIEEGSGGYDNDGDKEIVPDFPEQFKSCSNILEICNWLVDERPDVLTLAYQMFDAKKSLSLQKLSGASSNAVSSTQPVKI